MSKEQLRKAFDDAVITFNNRKADVEDGTFDERLAHYYDAACAAKTALDAYKEDKV